MSAKLLMPIIRKMSPTNSLDKSVSSSEETSSIGSGCSRRSRSSTSSGTSGLSQSPMATTGGGRRQFRRQRGDHAANKKNRYQVVVMGAGGVGKTSLVSRFLYDTVPEAHEATVEDLHAAEFPDGDGDIFRLELLDTSGTMPFPAMRALNIARGDGFVLVYSVTDPESFEEVSRLRDEILVARCAASNSSSSDGDGDVNDDDDDVPSVPIVIVGNKTDDAAASTAAAADEEQRVPSVVAETIVTIDWEHGFVETSAVTGAGVVDIFRELVKQSGLDAELVDAAVEKLPMVLPSTTSKAAAAAAVRTSSRRGGKSAKSNSSCVIN